MTNLELAAKEFKAWVHGPDDPQPPTNAQFAALGKEYLPFVRMAWLTMHKSKAEIVAMFDQEPEFCTKLADDFKDTKEWFESFADVLDGAYARMLVGAAVVVTREDAA